MQKIPGSLLVLFLCAILSLATSCGRGSDQNKDEASDTEEGGNLEVGTNFLNAPRTYLKFRNLSAGKLKIKRLRFLATRKGKLTLDDGALGIGIGCDSSGTDSARISVAFEFKKKDPTTGLFSLEPVKPDSGGFTRFFKHTYLLEQGDEVELKVTMTPYQTCDSGEVGILATFDDQ